MSSSIHNTIRNIIAPYLLIGGLGGAVLLILFYLVTIWTGNNPLYANFLFWDVIILSFTVFLAGLNYHIKNGFRGYKIFQTIVLNSASTILSIFLFTAFLGFILPINSDEVNEYKTKSINDVIENKSQFQERGLSEEQIDIYLADIRNKDSKQIAVDTFQKLFFASPFIVFVAFVLILLMHFGILISKEKMLRNANSN